MLLIVGLGNFGKEYEKTYHNMGFFVIDKLAEELGVTIKKAECSALTAVKSKKGEKIVLAKPTTYMNGSGDAVASLVAKYKSDDVIVIYDDIDIARFSVRARRDGSAGTHNGMRDIVKKLGTTAIKRVRIGVGRGDGELKDYVLSNIRKDDEEAFAATFAKVADALLKYVDTRDFDLLMRAVNG